jgi:hypothetical protein
VPEEVGTLGLSPQEPGAVHDVGYSYDDRLYEGRYVDRVVLQVGVLHDDDVSVHVSNSCPDGCALAAVRLPEHDQAVVSAPPALRDLGGTVDRTIVDHDHLLVEIERADPVQYFPEGCRFVECQDEK